MSAVIESTLPTQDPAAGMQAILARQSESFLAELPVSARSRIERLDRVLKLLTTHDADLCEAMNRDFGQRPAMLSRFTDVASSVGAVKHARKHLRQWMKPRASRVRFPLGLLGARATLQFQPKGVVGIISPWNFPVNLAFVPLADALAAGNRVMIKPSEYTPHTSELMAELVARYFKPEEVAVFPGGSETGIAFSRLPFDHLLFTGSTTVGHHIMRAAAENLTPVTLELGGKSPAVIAPDADLEKSAGRIVLGKLLNAGQVCLAPDYVLAPRARVPALVEQLKRAYFQMYPDGPASPDYTSIIDQRQLDRLQDYLAQARDHGVEIITLGEAAGDRRLPLSLLMDPDDSLEVMKDEIFGPLLPIKGYDSLDQAVAYINAHPRPLGLYLFGGGADQRRQVLDRTISGGVTLDDVIFHVSAEELPFGGIGASGMGAYHGEIGFQTFSHAKAVYRQSPLNMGKLLGLAPPYGKRLKQVVDWDMK